MTFGLQYLVDRIAFPSPASSYSLTSHPELFFIQSSKQKPGHPGVPCMMYAVPQGAPVMLVHAHSNGCDVGDMRSTLQQISELLKVHVMSFEFPGYGLHQGVANMRSINDAADIVLNYIVEELKVNLAQVVWYGRSIGSGPAMRLAHKITKDGIRPGGVVIQCGFANFPEVAGFLFGRMAKRLVSPLWQNEAMIKELTCPVLLIHGRNDTMIPISQSAKLWECVSNKEQSVFHQCDCGHNDFNFRRCTVRPIYDFLLGVISSASFPSANFRVTVAPSARAFVHHIGPLRPRIPVYSFRRAELEDWLRRFQSPKAAEKPKETSEKSESQSDDPENLKATRATDASDASTFKKVGEAPTDPQSAVEATAANNLHKGKGKGKNSKAEALPPIPDYSAMEMIEDISKALLTSEGMVRTCASRIREFLERIQQKLDLVEDLESKPVEEVVQMVEAEFWTCDPLLSLWEEVSAGGEVRFRFGPFSIDDAGGRHCRHGLAVLRSESDSWQQSGLTRVPLWLFTPSASHFRCLAEWSLLHSERLKNLPMGQSSNGGSTCCCVPTPSLKGKEKRPSRFPAQTMLGALATSFAAHYVDAVEKMEDITELIRKFVDLYTDPKVAEKHEALRQPVELGAFVSSAAARPAVFSASSRAFLRDGLCDVGTNTDELLSVTWLSGLVATPVKTSDEPLDLSVASLLRSSREKSQPDLDSCDPMREERRVPNAHLCATVKAFCAMELKLRREQQRLKRRQMQAASKPSVGDGDVQPAAEEVFLTKPLSDQPGSIAT